MEENVKQEALLRHLLSRKNQVDDEYVYSFLLGSRLFLSPHQLLTELHRLSTEDTARSTQWAATGKMCSKCRQLHTTNRAGTSSPKADARLSQSTVLEPKTVASAYATTVTANTPNGTDFRSQRFISSTFVNITAPRPISPDSPALEGEDTIRRRRRGRRRNQAESDTLPTPLHNVLAVDRSSTVSRDSGILSAVIDPEELDHANNNRGAAELNNSKKPFDNCNDSGYALDCDAAGDCPQCFAKSENERSSSFKQQLVHILREWVRHFPADFRNKRIMWTLNDVLKGCQSENEELNALCTEVVDSISRRTATQESYEQQLSEFDHENSLQTSQQSRKKDWMVNFVLKLKDAADVNELAQQLCLVETDLLRHVGAEEFLQLFTADGDEDVRTNLGACVRWFNRLSHLVATVVCMCRKRKHGRHVITFFARVASRCFELSNFNSSMAILTGLSLGPVTRLNKTWNKLILSELSKLQNVFDPSNNFLKYRSIYMSLVGKPQSPKLRHEAPNRYSVISQHSVASAASTSSQHGDSGIECDHETPTPGCSTSPCSGGQRLMKKYFTFIPNSAAHESAVVPFLVLLVKDVYFLNHAIQTVDEDGNINFEKLRNLSNMLRPLEEWKQVAPSYRKNDDIQDFLLRSPVQSDADLYLLSYKREAPTNRFEKQQLKSLKAEQELKKRKSTKSLRRKTT